MSNLVNNSYTRALASGFVVSTIPEFSKKSLPISLTSAVSMAVGRTFDSLSKEIGARRKALDANIAHLAVPTTCIALAAHHLLSPENSSILDVSAVIMGLIAADTKIIQPAIKFLAPTQSSYKALSLLQQVPLIKYYPSLLKISAAYGLSSLAAQLIENSLSASETLPLCEKFAIATFVSFAAVDLYPTFSSTFAGVKNFFTPPPPSNSEIAIGKKENEQNAKADPSHPTLSNDEVVNEAEEDFDAPLSIHGSEKQDSLQRPVLDLSTVDPSRGG